MNSRHRGELTQEAREARGELVSRVRTGTLDSPRVERLARLSGKMQYGYLKAPPLHLWWVRHPECGLSIVNAPD